MPRHRYVSREVEVEDDVPQQAGEPVTRRGRELFLARMRRMLPKTTKKTAADPAAKTQKDRTAEEEKGHAQRAVVTVSFRWLADHERSECASCGKGFGIRGSSEARILKRIP